MLRHLYHGSNKIITTPTFGRGNKHNDYGLGFYCTSKKALAGEWAARKQGAGYINEYTLRDDRFKILDLTKPPYDNVLNWLALLMDNRHTSKALKQTYPRELNYIKNNYLLDVSKFDIVIGYRADDAFYKFPESFIRSEITFESLESIYHAGNLGKQYVLISSRSFNNIKYINSKEVGAREKNSYNYRVKEASKYHQSLLMQDRYSAGTRLIDLVRDNALL